MAKKKNEFLLPPKKEVKPSGDKKKALQAFIKKGGASVPTVNGEEPFVNFNMKIPTSVHERINKAREAYPKQNVGQKSPGITINNWMLEAIEQKLNS